ncbi:MAG: D-tyrosyl-tRNA(Tyr) deacylase [Candidatus Marinimicrobia bacterium]|nr:D-tyrosyl-tRNA(Tyr) deacylase [Candidatus Neomarinimicrobiota bacterium]MCF7828839.1 D-tyrosyl-tRNA(Tyr) deacylase [Candidatus Neomarinimicrobiota bacterium]MCF7880756.1 D-tyrosyl-tRNA(Tyr) deacylase [Candidatus Neomarinimicrobiota bacterium]
MIAILQRATDARVEIDGNTTGAIDHGLVILLGVFEGDTGEDADYLADKSANLRIFNDENDKMNLSVKDVGGSVLVVSQFTLCADTRKGRRPSYINAANPEVADELYEYYIEQLQDAGVPVESGEFGAMMDVHLTNKGPVTIILDSRDR